MPLSPEAYTFRPFNAVETLFDAKAIDAAETQNALSRLQLQREENPASLLNRGRAAQVNAAEEAMRAAQLQNAIPALSSARQVMSSVKEITANRGVTAGRQMLSRQLWTLKNQGVIPEDFDLGIDLDELSDEDFAQEIGQAESDLTSMLSGLVPEAEGARVSAAIGDMQSLGYPMTQEGFRQYNDDKGSGTNEGLQALLDEARLRGILMDQDRAADADARAAQERDRERVASTQQVVRNLEQNAYAVDLTQRLEGTVLESGLPMSDLRRGLASLTAMVGGLAGKDTSGLEQVIGEFDTQRKLLQDQVNSRMSSGEYGRSATQLQSIQRSLANPDISPTAIIRIQGQLAGIDLDRAEADELEIPNREAFERQAKEWKEYDPLSANNISRMNRSQITQLDIDNLTDEQAEAALKRLDDLE